MTSTRGSTEGPAPPSQDGRPQAQTWTPPSLWGFVSQHKRWTLGGLAVAVLLTAAVVLVTLGSRISRISDSTSCSGWSAATQAQQQAYTALFLTEHHSLPGGATNPDSVETAVNNGCIAAFSFDEADSVSVLQAIHHQY